MSLIIEKKWRNAPGKPNTNKITQIPSKERIIHKAFVQNVMRETLELIIKYRLFLCILEQNKNLMMCVDNF